MYRLAAVMMLGLCACPAGPSAPKQAPLTPAIAEPEAPPEPPPTIAHRVLALEAESLPWAEDVTATLDAFLDAAVARIQAATLDGTERERALATLSLIAAELDAQHFVYPGRGLVDSMYDGLADLLMNGAGLALAASHPSNQVSAARQQLLRDAVHAPSTVFHVVDCDVFSTLYVAVGDRLDLPITMVNLLPYADAPEHVYVVWTLSDGTLVTWEATDGAERSDPTLDDEYYAPDGLHSKASHVARRTSGVPMNDDEIMGYWHRVVAGVLQNRSLDRGAVAAYREAIRLQPATPVAQSRLAWILLSSPDPHVRDPAAAIAVAEKLAADSPEAINVSLLAAAYASAGRWDDARTTVCQAIAMDKGLPQDGTCDAIEIDPDDPGLDLYKQELAMYMRCQAYVTSRPTEAQAELWRDYLGNYVWYELMIKPGPVPYVPPVDACGATP